MQSRLGGYGLVQANRELIREGEILKISRNTVDQRYLILCNDCLIYAKHASSALSEGSLKVSYKIPLANLTVDVPNAEEYPQDFNIRSPVRSCTLRADSATNRERWVSALNQAIAEHLSRRATFAKAAIAATVTAKPTPSRPSSRLQDDQQQQRQSSEQQQPRLGDSAPVWIPDERVTMCQSCHSDFTLLLRRHHCRACGLVFCYLCSGNRAPLKYSAYEQSRVCDCCFEDLRKSK